MSVESDMQTRMLEILSNGASRFDQLYDLVNLFHDYSISTVSKILGEAPHFADRPDGLASALNSVRILREHVSMRDREIGQMLAEHLRLKDTYTPGWRNK